MAETLDFNVRQKWLLANEFDISGGIVQLKGSGPVLVAVGGRPPRDSALVGFMLSRNGLMELPLPNMNPGDRIFLRSVQDEQNPVCVLLEY